LPLGTNGLYHSSNGGVTWTKIANVSVCNSMGIGSPAPAAGSPQSIFIYGTASPLGISALYRSDNNGASWLQINDTLHQYGGATLITADPQIYGRVYFGMNGRGIIYGDIAH
jgi:oligoxyloglucan reducing-end-specific cellobiohydrolase